jgi:hypothetical protein
MEEPDPEQETIGDFIMEKIPNRGDTTVAYGYKWKNISPPELDGETGSE